MNYLSSIGKINVEGAGARNSTMHEHGHASAKSKQYCIRILARVNRCSSQERVEFTDPLNETGNCAEVFQTARKLEYPLIKCRVSHLPKQPFCKTCLHQAGETDTPATSQYMGAGAYAHLYCCTTHAPGAYLLYIPTFFPQLETQLAAYPNVTAYMARYVAGCTARCEHATQCGGIPGSFMGSSSGCMLVWSVFVQDWIVFAVCFHVS